MKCVLPKHPSPLPLGEVAERSEVGEGKYCKFSKSYKTLSVTCGDSSPEGRAKAWHIAMNRFTSNPEKSGSISC